MEKRFVYADNAATTPMSETAFNAMKPWLTENYGNPSSLYRIGRAAKEALNDARTVVGKCLNAAEPVNEKNDYAPGEIVFTGGGSQADNLAIRGFMHGPSSKGRKHIITSKIEHHAVLYTCEALEKEGYRVTYLNVDKEGRVDLEQLKAELSEDTALVSVMAANNEIGTIQPIKQIAELAHSVGAKFHTDAVQAVGHRMTHSAAMASEILPGKTILEALNTDLVCDAINTAMRELFLQIVYGRTQSAFSEEGLPIGAGLEDLGKGLRSQVGTMYGTLAKGPRYLEMAEGYVTGIALDDHDEIIGYQFVSLGKFTDFVKAGDTPNEAWEKAKGQYGRVADALRSLIRVKTNYIT